MRAPVCLLALALFAGAEDDRDPKWESVESYLKRGLAAAAQRNAEAARPLVQLALEALEDLARADWSRLLAVQAEGWTFGRPNIQPSTAKFKDEVVGQIKGTNNARRPADGAMAMLSVNNSPAYLDSQRRLYRNPASVEAMRRTGQVETETRDGLLIAKRTQKMGGMVLVMGDHTVVLVQVTKDDMALLDEILGWIDLALVKQLDQASAQARAKRVR